MYNGGYIKISRDISSWQWYDVPEMLSLWVHMLLDANYEDRTWHGKIIPRGSFVTSVSQLSEESGLSTRTVRTCLSRFNKANAILQKSTNKNTIITICNYDSYQSYQVDERQTTDKQTTSKRQANDKPTLKEVKKEENKENINNKLLIQKKESFGFDLSFVEEPFKDAVMLWLAHKRGLGKSYKTQQSLQIAYGRWMKDFNHDPAEFSDAVEHSIAQNYEGIFKAKRNGNRINNRPTKEDRRNDLQHEVESDIRRIASCQGLQDTT